MSSKEFHNEMRRRQFVDDAQGLVLLLKVSHQPPLN